MLVKEIRQSLDVREPRSAWGRGVVAYAYNLLADLDEYAELSAQNVERLLLNGASDWNAYSRGCCALVYDEDIAGRLSTPSELKRNDHGRRPNGREDWLDVQERAFKQAFHLVKRIVTDYERTLMCVIGKQQMDVILGVTDKLAELVKDRFESGEGIYRINDFGDYISEADWETVWADYPSWRMRAWLLADNGQYTSDEVSAMSALEVMGLFDRDDFFPEYAYYTEADETGRP